MKRQDGKPLILGHRGSPGVAPENTLASFEAALVAGADGIELDLQITSDGVLVVHHDADVDDQQVSGLTQERFRELAPDAPMFSEVLDFLAAHPRCHLNIELKVAAEADGREVALAEALANWTGPARANAWVSSFDPVALARLGQLGVELPLALLVYLEDQLESLSSLNVVAVHPFHLMVTPERVEAWHKRGLAVFPWTVNDLSVAQSLLAAGVDGLIGDDPGALVGVRDFGA